MITLLVDDSDISLKVMEGILTNQGHACIGVQHGQEAIVCLENIPEIQLVISDIDMPDMNGLELLAEIKKRKEWLDIGVIICSNRADVETIKKVKALGCNFFLLKPVSEDQLMKKVQVACEGTPRVLQDQIITCHKFGLTPESYQEICTAFKEELGRTINLIEKEDADLSPQQRFAAVLKIQDGAELIGAPRLAKLFKPAKTQTASEQEIYFNEHSTQFLREFKALNNVLSSTLN